MMLYDNKDNCNGLDYPEGNCGIAAVHLYGSLDLSSWYYEGTYFLWHDGKTTTSNIKLGWRDWAAPYYMVARYAGGENRSDPWLCFVAPTYSE
ncbi:MAG: hypothetical protein HY791_27030 [Deltaproteobacteria bacterium]|nr:hypothetical protein [Deltaproteobacteria bacterium]